MNLGYLLDTDHVSIYQRGAGTQFAILSANITRRGPESVAISIVSYHEQVLGCHAYINRARSEADILRGYELLARIVRGIESSPLLPFDADASATLATFSGTLKVAVMDLRIAAIALSRGLVLLTRNRRDFSRVPGLRTEDWTT